MNENFVIADKFFKAVETGDIQTVGQYLHPEVIIWHNVEGEKKWKNGHQTRRECLRILKMLPDIVKGVKYDITNREATDTGFVQQHVLRGILPNGSEFAMPVLSMYRFDKGKITRVDEYIDSIYARMLIDGLTGFKGWIAKLYYRFRGY